MLQLYQLKKWAAEFKRGGESLEDKPKLGHPCTAPTQENIARNFQMMMDDIRLTVNHIANVMSISRQ